MIPQETIQRIFDAADIVEVVSDFVTLKKRGVNFIGLCPFHNEKTPSFYVSPAKGICKCFGCGQGGNSVNFLMEHDQMTYVEALRYLAKKYHIDIIEREETEEERIAKNERESMMIVSAYAEKYFEETLHQDSEGMSVGLSYLKQRGFRPEIIKKFHLGYCKDDWSAFSDKALADGYEQKYLVDTGLSIEGKKGLIDKYRGRVIFPIQSVSGRTVGFGGRILNNDAKAAKYLNSPESTIYHKSKLLYGLFLAKKSIVKADKCFLVEGYTDVISLHQAGIENVVASSGTSLTVGQILLIKRFTPNITVLFDGDSAGIKATLRGVDMLLEQGMNIKVLLLPDGEDPDSFAKKHSSAELLEHIKEHEEDFIHFKTNLLLKDAQNDPVKKANLIRDIMRSISVIPDSITRSVYIKSCSNLMGVQESVLYNQITALLTQKRTQTPQEIAPKPTEKKTAISGGKDYEEKALLRLLLNYGMHLMIYNSEEQILTAKYIINELTTDKIEFENPIYQKIIDEFREQMQTPNFQPEDFFCNHSDENVAKLTIDLMTTPHILSQIWTKNNVKIELEEDHLKEIVPKIVFQYKYKIVKKELKEITKKIKQTTDEQELIRLLKEKKSLDSVKNEILEFIGKRIIVK
ncbi:MAG: DNA primase [Flavobacteriaceae bacterium]|nr:DNA primase [Flavobacteriaceae bacterium]